MAETTVVVLLATATGSGIGLGLGVLLAFATWGFAAGLGLTVGTAAGLLSGTLAAADRSFRYAGTGQWAGMAVGLTAVAGLIGWAVAYGPGGGSLTWSDLTFLAGGFVFAGGAGWLAGRQSERVGRAIADA